MVSVQNSRSSLSYTKLQARAAMTKKAQKLLKAGKSLGEVSTATRLARSTLQNLRTNMNIDRKYHTAAQRQKIVLQVLKYVHKELLKKPKQYVRRRPEGRGANWKVVSYKEVRAYLDLRRPTTTRPRSA